LGAFEQDDVFRMWLRQLRSAISCVRARLTRRVSALTGRWSRRPSD